YLGGTYQQRLEDLHPFFADPKIQGIWCTRGGYGCTRLLPSIDFKLIKKNPKVFVGYSDVTALLQAFYLKSGLIGFHGPVASAPFDDFVKTQIEMTLMHPQAKQHLSFPSSTDEALTAAFEPQVIRPGQAQGVLMGGNLSLVSAMSGTRYDWKVKNKILFLEDVGERPYRIDRMLTQLLQSKALHRAAAILLGVFADCETDSAQSLTLLETLKDRLRPLDIPVIYGLPFGHIEQQWLLPVGINAALDTSTLQVTLLEASVQ
ncbi:MAG: LD-carboxypeptidase, partial [Bacteroidota bacterium]